MSILILTILVILGLILQSTLLNYFAIAGVNPDLVLIVVAFFSLFGGPYKGGLFGVFAGLLEDLLLGRFIGMNALVKGLTGLLIGMTERRIYKENILVPIIIVFVGSLINEFFFLLTGKIIGLNLTWQQWFSISLPVAVYNTCIVPLFYKSFFNSATKGKIKELL